MSRQERSAGFVIFARPPSHSHGPALLEFLLLNYGRHWDFPKGHVEAGEDDITAATRELQEETGITHARVVPEFHREMTYFFRHKKHGLIRKTVIFFLAEAAGRDVVLSHEHTGFAFLPYEQALKQLTFPTARHILEAAWQRLQAQSSSPATPETSTGP